MPFKNQHPLYSVWKGMIARCYNQKSKHYSNYGARGIQVCDRWKAFGVGFKNFVSDMGERPKNYTIERINNDLGYSPENCKWASRAEQQINQRVTRKVVIDGVQYVAATLAKQYGMKTDTIVARAASGLSLAEVVNKQRRVYLDGLKKGGRASGDAKKRRTHCPHGHEYSNENTGTTAYGHRYCKACKRQKAAKDRQTAKLS